MNPFEYHKYLINEYVLKKPGDTKFLHQRDKSSWKTDRDVIIEKMKFIWNEDVKPTTWEDRLAKKYYDKLFREYCICDLSRFKENMIANRFRIEKEIVSGKGQFICGEKSCQDKNGLRTWEVNFVYKEDGEIKNALIKIRLCVVCSHKLNYHSKKREVKRLKTKTPKSGSTKRKPIIAEQLPTGNAKPPMNVSADESETSEAVPESQNPVCDESLWKKSGNDVVQPSRDNEFDEYLADLLL